MFITGTYSLLRRVDILIELHSSEMFPGILHELSRAMSPVIHTVHTPHIIRKAFGTGRYFYGRNTVFLKFVHFSTNAFKPDKLNYKSIISIIFILGYITLKL